MYIIQDWTGRIMFNSKTFKTFDDAEYYLSIKLGEDYDTDRQEYFITEDN